VPSYFWGLRIFTGLSSAGSWWSGWRMGILGERACGLGLFFYLYTQPKLEKGERMPLNYGNHARVDLKEFTRKSIALNDVDFEKAMRMENGDDEINKIKIIAQPLSKYGRG
jgi:hypothetical protein